MNLYECARLSWSLMLGPHTLAAAARLPGCRVGLCVCGIAPYEAEGLDFLAGQGEDSE